MRCVDLYNQAQSKWFEEMVTTTLVSGQGCVDMMVEADAEQPLVVVSGHGGDGVE